MKLEIVGSVDCRFDLTFRIRNAGGVMVTANLYHYETLTEVYKTLEKFYAARKKVVRDSSASIFGGGHPVHSMEWLAGHSCEITIYDALKDNARVEYFKQPYLEKIDGYFDN